MEKTSTGIISLAPNQFKATVGESIHIVQLLDGKRVRVDDRTYSFDLAMSPSGAFSLLLDGSVFDVRLADSNHGTKDNSLQLNVNGSLYNVTIEDHRSLMRKSILKIQPQQRLHQEIKAPMPGKVVRIEVGPGTAVKHGTGLIVLEAMKMENEIKSTIEGSIERIYVEPGQAVEKGEVLISVKAN